MESIKYTDVVVLGAGSAGIAAAVAIARRGLQVILIERNAYPGGKATAAEVGTVCGLYRNSKNQTAEFIVKGFAREFAETLQQRSGSTALHNADGLHYLPYNIDSFKDISLGLLHNNNVTTYFNSVLETVQKTNGKIISVSVIADGNPVTIHLKSIIDCSGDSIISRAAGLPLIKSDNYQAAAQVFTMQGIEETNEARLGMIIIKAIRSAIEEDKLANFYDRVYIVQGSLKNKLVSLKVGIPLPVTYAPGNLQELRTVAHSFVENLVEFLTTQVPAFKNASIQHIAPEVGIRIGQRSIGKYILTENDVLPCKQFEDAIANASWPIEEWSQQLRVSMRFLEGECYQVPAGCLQSAHTSNLFFAGRNISANDAAIASARVMGICLQTGYAAGCMAAAVASDISLAEVIEQIQNDQL
ncbi:MAG: FAD-dependent oxidoreductase [Chitinophagaceae bacterium]|nr:FAD-dependent oxidoreductase [Chitinophagaceae bacterium]